MILPHEQYTLTLRHEYVDSAGQHYSLDEPIMVSYSVMHIDERSSVPPSAIVINEMMERMRKFMIKSMIERGRQDETN